MEPDADTDKACVPFARFGVSATLVFEYGTFEAGTRSQQQPVTAILLRRGEAVRCGKFGDQRDVLF